MTTTRRHYKDKVYETVLLRRSFREGGKVRNETVANLSHLPAELIEVIRRSLAGEAFVPAGQAASVARSLPHGHVAAIVAQAAALGFPGLLGPPGRTRDVALALIVARVARPGSKLATTRWWADTTLDLPHPSVPLHATGRPGGPAAPDEPAWRDVLTGAVHMGGRLPLAQLTERLPVALLVPA